MAAASVKDNDSQSEIDTLTLVELYYISSILAGSKPIQTKLYICYTCPFAQRVWITRNYKGLQEKIELVPINLQNRPAWYKEKLYPENKVPSLEHNGKIIGESLDLIKYVDSNFEGPSLLPNDPAKREFAEELIAYTDTFIKTVFTSFKGDPVKEVGPVFDHLEKALHKFDDGPFFLGQLSLWLDHGFQSHHEGYSLSEVNGNQSGLEINKIDAYEQTKTDPKELVEFYKARFLTVEVYGEMRFALEAKLVNQSVWNVLGKVQVCSTGDLHYRKGKIYFSP
ncbi:Glutathione S-transferase L3 [Morella rubra]|uniref:Glutathione S-transferase L3 n=1 Tax=Morella rubra TaxID=262757 RepID=A0A6A1WHN5_9ROSI|nr:Glutathione S-transferase L3 [Morella rubra]